jgi:hypothetical protein
LQIEGAERGSLREHLGLSQVCSREPVASTMNTMRRALANTVVVDVQTKSLPRHAGGRIPITNCFACYPQDDFCYGQNFATSKPNADALVPARSLCRVARQPDALYSDPAAIERQATRRQFAFVIEIDAALTVDVTNFITARFQATPARKILKVPFLRHSG